MARYLDVGFERIASMLVDFCINQRAKSATPYPQRFRRYLSRAAAADALAEIASWPGYAPTPQYDLGELAQRADLGRLVYKDESGRFGLGSFKALGGAYAVARLSQGHISPEPDAGGRSSELVICAATDGNHGRSVAWGAQRIGCRCIIYLHEGVSPARERAIGAFGAEIRRVAGNYDDSVRAAEADARANGWTVVSDTSYPGYKEIPCAVMQGYAVMLEEITSTGLRPTHIFVQGGVGGLAAAVCAHFWEAQGSAAPRIIVVEPMAAACLQASARAGRPTAIHGTLETVMAGLACGEVSEVAWEILSEGAMYFMAVPDSAAIEGMRLLAAGGTGAPPIVAGESATVGLAAVIAASQTPVLRAALGLTGASCVLCFGTEGDTDPTIYREIAGQDAGDVRSAAARESAML